MPKARIVIWILLAVLTVATLGYVFFPGATPSEQELFSREEIYRDHFEPGRYHCTKCGQALFAAEDKVRRESRWPVFSAPLPDAVVARAEAFGEGERVKVRCSQCHLHAGYLCQEGEIPRAQPGAAEGSEYCVLSSSLRFVAPGASSE